MRDPEDTVPLPFRKDPLRYAWAGWLILVVAAIVCVLALSGCATLPPCPKFAVSIYPTQKGPVFVIDEANMLIMAGRMQQLQERSRDPDAPEVEVQKPKPKPAADPTPEPWRHELKGA